jgi:hypothetical protein
MEVKRTCLGEEMATAAMAEEAQAEAISAFQTRFFFSSEPVIGVWKANTCKSVNVSRGLSFRIGECRRNWMMGCHVACRI